MPYGLCQKCLLCIVTFQRHCNSQPKCFQFHNSEQIVGQQICPQCTSMLPRLVSHASQCHTGCLTFCALLLLLLLL